MMRAFRAVWVLALLFLLSGAAHALPITQQLIVNPIQVCDDSGENCANPDLLLYEAEADKIWLQAGIDIEFLPWKQWNNSSVLTISSTYDLDLPGNQALGGDVINVWFVNEYTGAYGAANSANRRVAVGDGVFSYTHPSDPGTGRRDTLAHELGHIMGLSHYAPADPLNLMTTGGSRNVVTQLVQITPGTTPDPPLTSSEKAQLLAAQIEIAVSSDYLQPIPEPAAGMLFGAGLVWMAVSRRRRLH